jgi:hypothetical protein
MTHVLNFSRTHRRTAFGIKGLQSASKDIIWHQICSSSTSKDSKGHPTAANGISGGLRGPDSEATKAG